MTAALPPEISSAAIYAGPGGGSLIAAAAAWEGTAEELEQFAAGYRGTLSGLDSVWAGPSAVAMSTNAVGYTQWIDQLALQAHQVSAAAAAAVAAFHAVHAAVTPPPVIATNRAQLAMLVATNILGQNTPAIAATEAGYMTMWATNIAALLDYQSTSAAATDSLAAVTPGPSPAASPADVLNNLLTSVASGETFQSLVSSGIEFSLPLSLLTLLAAGAAVEQTQQTVTAQASPTDQTPAPTPPPAPPTTANTSAAAAATPERLVSARMGAGRSLGPLTVPATWKTGADQPARITASENQPSSVAPFGSSFAGPGGTPPKRLRPPPEYGTRPRFIPRPPGAG